MKLAPVFVLERPLTHTGKDDPLDLNREQHIQKHMEEKNAVLLCEFSDDTSLCTSQNYDRDPPVDL